MMKREWALKPHKLGCHSRCNDIGNKSSVSLGKLLAHSEACFSLSIKIYLTKLFRKFFLNVYKNTYYDI